MSGKPLLVNEGFTRYQVRGGRTDCSSSRRSRRSGTRFGGSIPTTTIRRRFGRLRGDTSNDRFAEGLRDVVEQTAAADIETPERKAQRQPERPTEARRTAGQQRTEEASQPVDDADEPRYRGGDGSMTASTTARGRGGDSSGAAETVIQWDRRGRRRRVRGALRRRSVFALSEQRRTPRTPRLLPTP